MKHIIYLLGIFIALFSSSCSYWVAAPYTNVDKITKIKPGMSIEQVNSTLGISPYNIYHIQDDGGSVLTYKYRIKNRRMNVPYNRKHQIEVKASEGAQTGGSAWYDGQEQTIYILFKDLKVKSLISDEGINKGEYLLIKDNNLRIITKKEYNSIRLFENTSGTNLLVLNEKNVIQKVDLPKEKIEDSNTIIVGDGSASSVSSSQNFQKQKVKQDKSQKQKLVANILKIYVGVGAIILIIAAAAS